MKIFAIRDETDKSRKDLAWLLYYEIPKKFYIELPDCADPWETPLLLSSFAQAGTTSINSYWSGLWVQQRIIPPDRQNIQQILQDNSLKEYDEFGLLMLSKGRCAQDDYYLVPITENRLPGEIQARLTRRLEDLVPLQNNTLLCFFRDGTVQKCDLTAYFETHREFSVLLNRPEFFRNVRMQAGGHGISWDENLMIDNAALYAMGIEIPLSMEDFCAFARERIVNTQEAAELLDCSRQYIAELVKNGKLHPLKASDKNTLFLKSEILKRMWS